MFGSKSCNVRVAIDAAGDITLLDLRFRLPTTAIYNLLERPLKRYLNRCEIILTLSYNYLSLYKTTYTKKR